MADNPAASPSEFVADLKRAAAAEGTPHCRLATLAASGYTRVYALPYLPALM